MRSAPFLDLVEGTEFRQALQARPPRVVHGTLLLLVALLGTALLWAIVTKADLVVRTPGRVRPATTPTKVVHAVRSDGLSASVGGRVVEVNFREGEAVHRGDALLRLDTGQLDHEIAKRKRMIQSAEEELAKLVRLEELSSRQFEATRAKLEAELAQALEEVRQAKERRAVDIRLADVELELAMDEEGRLRKLAQQQAAATADRVKAAGKVREARAKREKAQLPVEEGKLETLRRALTQAEKDQAVKREELAIRQGLKQGEIEAARLERERLELEREQATLRAPTDGIVLTGDVKVGDVLETGKTVVELAEQKGLVFEVAVPSEEAAHLRVGMPARIKLDAYDYQKYGTVPGTVCFIAPDSTVAERQPTAAYLVKIRVEGDVTTGGTDRGRVQLGMAGHADIITDRESILTILVKKIRRTISLG